MLIDKVIRIKNLVKKLLISSILIFFAIVIIYFSTSYRIVLEGFETALVASIVYHLILILIFLDLKKLLNRPNIKITSNFVGGIYELIIVVIYNLIVHILIVFALIKHAVGIMDLAFILFGLEFILLLGVAGSYASRARKYSKFEIERTHEFAKPQIADSSASFKGFYDDQILMFLDEYTIEVPNEFYNLHKIYVAYVKWCFIHNTKSQEKEEFISKLEDNNCEIVEIDGQRLLKGRKLKPFVKLS